jgi:hypothetical protein
MSTAKWRTVDGNEIDSDVNEIKTSYLTGTELFEIEGSSLLLLLLDYP